MAIEKLDNLTWGFRISKVQERNSPTVWVVLYVNPNNKTWYSTQGDNLLAVLQEAIISLEGRSLLK